MVYTVSITSQGQISIPVELRRKYGLEETKKAVVYSSDDQRIIIEPVRDFFSLKGSLKTSKKIPFKKAREEFEKYMANRNY